MERIVNPREYDYIERQKLIQKLCENYKFIKKCSIGKSCLGKEITALKIGDANSYCLIAAAFHGSERISSTVALMFLEELCFAYKNSTYIAGLKMPEALRDRGAIIIPCVNPDGCDISLLGKSACGNFASENEKIAKGDFTTWNANARGVDINHNFNADWESLRRKERAMGIYGAAPTRYGGPSPESEPETQALTRFCRNARIRHVLALHTQGEVIYWRYGDIIPKRSRRMAEIMATASSYALDTPIGIADGGGFKDWFIEEFSRPGFTIELGLGKNPLDAALAGDIYLKAREMLTLSVIM